MGHRLAGRAVWLGGALVAAVSCSATPTPVCPPGTKAAGGQPPEFWSAWCERPDGTRQGPLVGYTDDGRRLYEGGYDGGFWDGTFVYYGKDDEVLGSFAMKRGDGPWKVWDVSGALLQEGTYKDGKKSGLWVGWHQNGKKAVEGQYEDGLEHGLFRWWTDGGALSSELTYDKGRQHGVQKTFDEAGELLEESEYVHGARVKVTRYAAGQVVSSETFALPEAPLGNAVTKSHTAISASWQTCERHTDCEIQPTSCCACGAGAHVALHFRFAEEARKALRATLSCESAPCPAQSCTSVRARCDEGRCVTVE